MKDYHYHFGIHSNIPECCARFYQDMVDAGIENIASTCRPEYLDLDKYMHIRYVLCNECARKEKLGLPVVRDVHNCRLHPNADCIKFL